MFPKIPVTENDKKILKASPSLSDGFIDGISNHNLIYKENCK